VFTTGPPIVIRVAAGFACVSRTTNGVETVLSGVTTAACETLGVT